MRVQPLAIWRGGENSEEREGMVLAILAVMRDITGVSAPSRERVEPLVELGGPAFQAIVGQR